MTLQVDKPDLFLRSRHYVAPRIQALQTSVLSASRGTITFSCQLASARLSWLRQHAVNGAAVLSAAALAEMATAAVKLLHDDGVGGSGTVATAALAITATPRLAVCELLSTTVNQDGSVHISAADSGRVATAHAAVAAHVDTQAAASASANRQHKPAPSPFARIVRSSPLLADAAAPSRPLAALRLSPGAEDGFWVHPGLLSAALVLADTVEQPAADTSHMLLALNCYVAGDVHTAALQTDQWALAAAARGANILTSQKHCASVQVAFESLR